MPIPYELFRQRIKERFPESDDEEIERLHRAHLTKEFLPEDGGAPPGGAPTREDEMPGYSSQQLVDDLQRGFANIWGQGTGGLLQFLGAEEFGGDISDYWRQVARANPPHPSIAGKSVWDEPEVLANPIFWMSGLAEQVNTLPLMFLGGGVGGKLATKLGLGRMGTAMTRGTLAGGIPETMPEFSQAVAEGMPPWEARARAIPSMLGVGALNAAPMDVFFGGRGGGMLRRILAGGAAEGVSEWLEEPTQALAFGRDPMEALKQGLNVLPIASVMGGGMSALTQPRQQQPNPYQRGLDMAESMGMMPKPAAAWRMEAPRGTTDFSLEDSPISFRQRGKNIVGSPQPRTPESVEDVIQTMEQALANPANASAANWYEQAGETIRNITHGDPELAERVVRLTALLSPQNEVSDNWREMVETAYQIARGNITKQHLKMLPSDFRRLLKVKQFDKSQRWIGPKVQSFYRNLRDTTFGTNEYPDAVTLDQWMARMMGYKGDRFSETQYDFMTKAVQEATRRHNEKTGANLLPRQAQAMMWAQTRNPSVSAGAAESFTEAASRATQNVTYETIPSTLFKDGQTLAGLPQSQKAEFTRRALSLLTDEKGQDMLLSKLGIPLYHERMGTGGYDGAITPNVINGIQAMRLNSHYDRSYVNAYTKALQYLFRQDAVPWFRADPTLDTTQEGVHQGVYLRFSEPLTPQAEEVFFERLRDSMGSDAGYTKLSPNEVAVINFEDAPSFLENLDEFLEKNSQDLTITPDAVHFGTEGDYPYHDWQADPEGQALREELAQYQGGSPGAPDLLEWLDNRREAFDRLAEEFPQEVSGEPWRLPQSTIDQTIEESGRVSDIAGWQMRPPTIEQPVSEWLEAKFNKYDRVIRPDRPFSREMFGEKLHPVYRHHQKAIAAAIEDIRHAGLSDAALDSVGTIIEFEPAEGQGDMAYFYPPDAERGTPGFVAINSRILEVITQAAPMEVLKNLRYTLAHELGHALDIGTYMGVYQSHSAYSPLFYIDPFGYTIETDEEAQLGGYIDYEEGAFGPIIEDVLKGFQSKEAEQDGFQRMMMYPMMFLQEARMSHIAAKYFNPMTGEVEEIGGKDLRDAIRRFDRDEENAVERAIGMQTHRGYANQVAEAESILERIKGEVWAQLHGMYYAFPDLLKKHAPRAYEFTEKVINDAKAEPLLENTGPPNEPAYVTNAVAVDRRLQADFQTQSLQDYLDERGAPRWAFAARSAEPGAGTGPAAAGQVSQQIAARSAQRAATHWGITAATPEMVSELGGVEAARQAKRGTITWEETERLAKALGVPSEHLRNVMERELGKTFSAEELEGAADAVSEAFNDFQEMLRTTNEKIGQGRETPEDLAKAAEYIASMGAAGAQYLGVSGEAGRALQILRKHTDSREKIKQFLRLSRGIHDEKDLRAAINAMSHLNEPGDVARSSRQLFEVNNVDRFMEWYYFTLLSGIPTHVVNVVSTGIMGVIQEMDTLAASAIGNLTNSNDAITWEEVKARFRAIGTGSRLGLHEAARVFRDFEKEDFEEFGPTKDDRPHKRAFGGRFGKVVRIPMRLLSTEDTYWKALLYNMGIAQQAQVEANQTGRSVEDLMNDPTDSMKEVAWSQATSGTFTTRAGEFGQAIMKLRRSFWPMNLIFPFTQTPANIVKTGLKHTLAAPIFREVRDDIRAGGRARDMALARIGIGTAISASVYLLAAAGLVTGMPPEDPNERRLWYQQGNQPNSVRFGDTWVSYSRLEPFGMLLGIAADIFRLGNKIGVEEADKIWAAVIGSVANNITSKTYLRGLSDFITMMDDPERYGRRYIQRFLSTFFVPTGVAYTARASDDRMRDVQSLLDAIKARVPGARQTLPERLDIAGEPITETGSGLYRMVSPAYLNKVSGDTVADELMKYEVSFPAIGKKYRGVDLEPETRNELVRLTGKPTYQALRRFINSKAYQGMPDPWRKVMLQKVIDDTRRMGRLYWSMKHPEIMQQARELAAEKKYGTGE